MKSACYGDIDSSPLVFYDSCFLILVLKTSSSALSYLLGLNIRDAPVTNLQFQIPDKNVFEYATLLLVRNKEIFLLRILHVGMPMSVHHDVLY